MVSRYNKIILASLILVLISITSASWASNQYIYLGGNTIFSNTQFNWENADNSQNVLTDSTKTTQLGVFLGYGVVIDSIYLGAEGGIQFGSRKAQNELFNDNLQMDLENQLTMSEIYMVDFRPGYVFWNKNNLIYGILGLNTANFHAQQWSDEDNNNVFNSGPMRENGLRIGVGYNLALGRYFMARVDYVFTKFFINQFQETYVNGQTVTWQLNPYSNEVSIGLAVVFNIL